MLGCGVARDSGEVGVFYASIPLWLEKFRDVWWFLWVELHSWWMKLWHIHGAFTVRGKDHNVALKEYAASC